MKSKWPGECAECGAKWEKAAEIVQVEYHDSSNKHWCSNENCKADVIAKKNKPKTLEDSTPEPPPAQTLKMRPPTPDPEPETKYYLNTKIPNKVVDIHRDIWGFAIQEATKVYPDNDGYKSRLILAQVYYKKLMDYMIHHG